MCIKLPKQAIIIVGLPGSGKTLGASYLDKLGYYIVSAGNIIRDMCRSEGIKISRNTLQKFGKKLLQDKGFNFFTKILLQKSYGSEKVVFEGIRPVHVVNSIKSKIPKSLIIFIEANDSNRKKRLKKKNGINQNEFYEVMKEPLELEVLKIRLIADIIIKNDKNMEHFYESLRHAVISWCEVKDHKMTDGIS